MHLIMSCMNKNSCIFPLKFLSPPPLFIYLFIMIIFIMIFFLTLPSTLTRDNIEEMGVRTEFLEMPG